MKRAGRAAFAIVRTLWPETARWLVLCGAGNNGGDGYIVAALAQQKGHEVQVFWVSNPDKLHGDARRAYEFAQQEGVRIEPFAPAQADAWLAGDTVVVDAMLGTGLTGEVRESYRQAIDWVNRGASPVLAIDIPSGLAGDTGEVLGAAIQAAATVTFLGLKAGLLTGRGPVFSGRLFFDDLQVPASIYERVDALAEQIDRPRLLAHRPAREWDAHKGDFGHVMVVGGDHGFGGAAIMAAEAAAYSGAGLTSLATQHAHVAAALTRRPELMVLGVPSGQELKPHLQRPSVMVVGPGLGRSPWSEQLLQQVLGTDCPLVVDADALNIIAEGRLSLPEHRQWVLTPHPGEAARLLQTTVAAVQSNRFAAARALEERFGGVIVLKGLGTVVCYRQQLVLARVGNPGLARGGSGDVLSGLLGSLIAQKIPLFEAAQLAVCVHGDAADLLAEDHGAAGMLASELNPYIRQTLNV